MNGKDFANSYWQRRWESAAQEHNRMLNNIERFSKIESAAAKTFCAYCSGRISLLESQYPQLRK